MKYVIIILTLFILPSCLKQEDPFDTPKAGNIETVTIEIGYPYKNQVFYDCETNSIVSTNTKWDWDIAFECSGKHIILNTAKGVLAANKGVQNFNNVNSISGVKWLWDASSGNLDSTAIGDWENKNEIFIIDRQYDEQGNHLGYVKIQFQSVTDENYTFKYADLNGNNEHTFTVVKDKQINFIAFSFDSGKSIAIEPASNNWDLVFTNHQHKFSNLSLPFVLTQVLGNTYNGVTVAEDNNGNFFNINFAGADNYEFTNIKDEIGYDWKIRNSADNSFTIDGNKSFIVKTVDGFYYKIRFIDFYNSEGSKGYPKFEIQRL